jgi:hypothetical protein
MYEAELVYKDGRKAMIDVPDGPVCVDDLCDECDDCLACYGDEPCTIRNWHSWVVHEDRLAKFLDGHTGASVRA